jgi:hypothetical protein
MKHHKLYYLEIFRILKNNAIVLYYKFETSILRYSTLIRLNCLSYDSKLESSKSINFDENG